MIYIYIERDASNQDQDLTKGEAHVTKTRFPPYGGEARNQDQDPIEGRESRRPGAHQGDWRATKIGIPPRGRVKKPRSRSHQGERQRNKIKIPPGGGKEPRSRSHQGERQRNKRKIPPGGEARNQDQGPTKGEARNHDQDPTKGGRSKERRPRSHHRKWGGEARNQDGPQKPRLVNLSIPSTSDQIDGDWLFGFFLFCFCYFVFCPQCIRHKQASG